MHPRILFLPAVALAADFVCVPPVATQFAAPSASTLGLSGAVAHPARPAADGEERA